MPAFRRRLRFTDMSGERSFEAEALVDSGATFSQLPAEAAEDLHLVGTRSRRFRLANGQVVERQLAHALIVLPETDEPPAPTTIVIGDRGSTPLLGTHDLDVFGLGIDTFGSRLIPRVLDLLNETGWPTI